MDLVNTVFSEKNITAKMSAWGEDISTWENGFFLHRAEYIVPALAEEFELEGTLEKIHISLSDSNGGTVCVNTVTPKFEDGNWSGEYFTDYPITVTAVANRGYRFVGWEGDIFSEKEEIKVALSTGGTNIRAVFEKIGEDYEE